MEPKLQQKKKTGGQTAHEYGRIMLSQSSDRWNKGDNKVILMISMTDALKHDAPFR